MPKIFAHFINRELHDSLEIAPQPSIYLEAIRTFQSLFQNKLYCNISQGFEFARTFTELWDEIIVLNECDSFWLDSGYATWDEFAESRRTLYSFDRGRYPMYFGRSAKTDFSRVAPTPSTESTSTTAFIETSVHNIAAGTDKLANWPTSEERKILQQIQTPILTALSRRDDKALTYAALKPDLAAVSPRQNSLMRRGLTASYVEHYIRARNGQILHGIPKIKFYDRCAPDNPYWLSFQKQRQVVRALGLHRYLDSQPNYGRRERCSLANDLVKATFSSRMREWFTGAQYYCAEIGQDSDSRWTHLIRVLSTTVGDNLGSDLTSAYERGLFALEQSVKATTDADSFALGVSIFSMSAVKKLLILTATDTEDQELYRALREAGCEIGDPKIGGGFVSTQIRTPWKCTLEHVRTSAGSTTAGGSAVTAAAAIRSLQIDHVIAIGICFGMQPKKQKIGDVVVSTSVKLYEPGRTNKDGTFIARGEKMPAGVELLGLARAVSVDRPLKPKYGLFLSGEKLVDSQPFVDALLKLEPEAAAGEMEAAGIVVAAHTAKCEWLIVKGICDWGANKNKNHQNTAAKNACEFAVAMIQKFC